jgi:hypothetical protein
VSESGFQVSFLAGLHYICYIIMNLVVWRLGVDSIFNLLTRESEGLYQLSLSLNESKYECSQKIVKSRSFGQPKRPSRQS